MRTTAAKAREIPATRLIPDMSLVLSVISADNQKDAGEMKLLAALIEGLNIPDKIMSNVCDQNFEGK